MAFRIRIKERFPFKGERIYRRCPCCKRKYAINLFSRSSRCPYCQNDAARYLWRTYQDKGSNYTTQKRRHDFYDNRKRIGRSSQEKPGHNRN